METQTETISLPPDTEGKRLDQALADVLSDYSRARIQQWIKSGHVTIDGQKVKSKMRVIGNEIVQVCIPADQTETEAEPEPIPLDVVYEDDALIVINKPVGLVVHPAAGNWTGTLVNGLLYRYPELQQLPRAGIVHRLDKDTSGLMVVARNLAAHKYLVEALQARAIKRQYQAIVQGVMTAGGTVDAPIGRHPKDRLRMAVIPSGKEAVTHYRIADRYREHTLLDVQLETGRTHQIRVHMAYIRHPIVGDQVYGGRQKVPAAASEVLIEALKSFGHQALHACLLELEHPVSGQIQRWQQPVPDDFGRLQALLKQDLENSI